MIPVVVVLLLIGGVVAAQQGLFARNNASTTSPSVMATQQTATPSATSSQSTGPTATPTSTTSSSTASDPTTQEALDGCQDRVRAADKVLDAAKVGVGHWSEHVQAQTDANEGEISQEKMDAIFKRTRLAGPDDVEAYEDAVQAYDKLKSSDQGSCEAPAGATATVQKKMSRCAERSTAQKPVLEAADDGMDDWESHLAAMRRSRMGHVHDAEGVWIRAWRAAPPHISAYEKKKDFDAPAC